MSDEQFIEIIAAAKAERARQKALAAQAPKPKLDEGPYWNAKLKSLHEAELRRQQEAKAAELKEKLWKQFQYHPPIEDTWTEQERNQFLLKDLEATRKSWKPYRIRSAPRAKCGFQMLLKQEYGLTQTHP